MVKIEVLEGRREAGLLCPWLLMFQGHLLILLSLKMLTDDDALMLFLTLVVGDMRRIFILLLSLLEDDLTEEASLYLRAGLAACSNWLCLDDLLRLHIMGVPKRFIKLTTTWIVD